MSKPTNERYLSEYVIKFDKDMIEFFLSVSNSKIRAQFKIIRDRELISEIIARLEESEHSEPKHSEPKSEEKE